MKKIKIALIVLFSIILSAPMIGQITDVNDGFLKTESGLQIKIYNPGTGDFPSSGDKVLVHYTGKLLDGTVFDSSIERNQPFNFEIGSGQVIKGWDEGIALLKKGGQATLIIPPALGYGSREMGKIPANSVLLFDVTLIDIQKGINIKPYDTSGKTVMTTNSGLNYYIIENGNGEKAIPGRNVKINYTGYLQDGKMFDSTIKKGQLFKFNLGSGAIMRGLDEGVALMRIGDKVRFILPPELGFGDKENAVIPANSTLVFDVELVEIEPEVKVEPFNIKDKKTYTTNSGLQYIIEKEGNGKSPKNGQTVILHYTGYLQDGSIFDSSVRRNETFSFPLGEGKVIKGWEEGIALMKVGDRIRFIIPPDLAYGDRSVASIPPNSTLIFDVELIDIK